MNIKNHNSNEVINLEELISSGVDFLIINISKDEILNDDTSKLLNIFRNLISKKEISLHFKEKIEIFIDGYNHTNQNLWEIPEVRDFISNIDTDFPFWFYFLNKESDSLFVILRCFLLPFLKPEAEIKINKEKLRHYIENRGFPAMNQICKFTEISESENIEMTNRIFTYINSYYKH